MPNTLSSATLPYTPHPLLWAILKRFIRWKFPSVRHISTSELGRRQQLDRLLLDVRTEAEFAVSHLQNARLADPSTIARLALPPDTSIVAYCSVGYRSARLCDRLQSAGYTNVTNLEGSLFQWANEGRPVYQQGAIVTQVHPYNRRWGILLARQFHP